MRVNFRTYSNNSPNFMGVLSETQILNASKGAGFAEQLESFVSDKKLEPDDIKKLSTAIPELLANGKKFVASVFEDIINSQKTK